MTNERKEIAEIFRQAKKVLAKDRYDCSSYRVNGHTQYETYICHAIGKVGLFARYRDPALAVIHDRLDNVYSLETWVISNIPGMYFPVDKNEMQAYRHRWLDSLIEEFSNDYQ